MNSLRDLGSSLGQSSGIGMRLVAQLVPQLTAAQRTSLRAMLTAVPSVAHPPTPPPPPAGHPALSLSVTNQAPAFFDIVAVAWSIERQELNGTFTLVASPSGQSAVVVPPTLGQYHIHGVVSVNSHQTGETIDAEFRGNTTIHGLHTQLVVWTGIAVTENFRLFAEPPSGAEVNPVVAL